MHIYDTHATYLLVVGSLPAVFICVRLSIPFLYYKFGVSNAAIGTPRPAAPPPRSRANEQLRFINASQAKL